MTTTVPKKQMTVMQAAFIGVGSMVGAGIFALLGAAGAVAGSAVWVSFLVAGAIAGLQGYSFAKLGATYPSGGGMLAYLARGFGEGHVTGIVSWLFYVTGAIVGAMVASSFGGYASAVLTGRDPGWAKVFAVALIVVMTFLNAVGSTAVAKVQSLIVKVVLAILSVFAIVTIVNWNPALLDPAGYPGVREIIASVALTFFAFLGFGVITFTAKDLPDPSRQLPRAMYLALAIATTVYVAVSLGVFGTLTADQVVAYGATALAEAAKPTLGQFGYVLMVITALLSTAGAVNASLYPSVGMTRHLASVGQFPPVFGTLPGPPASAGRTAGHGRPRGGDGAAVQPEQHCVARKRGGAAHFLRGHPGPLQGVPGDRRPAFHAHHRPDRDPGDVPGVLHHHARQRTRHRRRAGGHPCPGPDHRPALEAHPKPRKLAPRRPDV